MNTEWMHWRTDGGIWSELDPWNENTKSPRLEALLLGYRRAVERVEHTLASVGYQTGLDLRALRSLGIIAVAAGLLIAPAALTLQNVSPPTSAAIPTEAVSPLGYTWSLSLFLFPLAVLWVWFALRRDLTLAHRAFWPTVGTLTPIGFLLDLCFGNRFFRFPNSGATLGWRVPALGGGIPIEEFVFYLSGFMVILLTYIWADEYWLRAYRVEDSARTAPDHRGSRPCLALALAVGGTLIGAALVYRQFGSRTPANFPWYFIYLTVASLVPAVSCFRQVHRCINSRAFGVTLALVVLVSVLWEVTLALPCGWWDYQPDAMLGLQIGAWHNLPIEAVFVWFAAAFTTISVYEQLKLRCARRG